jgi:3-oxoacyl-[acyl-carrier protein] reductase
MSDFLLENSGARKLVKSLGGLGLPLPLPYKLSRAKGPYEERPLDGKVILVGGERSEVSAALAKTLTSAGAEPYAAEGASLAEVFQKPGEAYGRPLRTWGNGNGVREDKAAGMVFDATTANGPDNLARLYEFFHPLLETLAANGRIVVIGRPPAAARTVEEAAAQAALTGFVKSLAKEVGKRGATTSLITVAKGAEDRIEGVLRFLLSPRSAFVTGQVFEVTAKVKAPPAASWVLPLEGKVALVTGAARGIGEAIVKRLAQEGAYVVGVDRADADGPLSRLARDVKGSALVMDITEVDAPERMKKRLLDEHKGVDIIVHNAGVTRDRTLKRMSQAEWDVALAVNLHAVTRATAALLGSIREGGRVICLSSVAGIAGNMGQTNYAASKAGLIGFVQALAGQVASKGITANAIAPGFIETKMTAAIPPMIREAGRRLSALSQGGLPVDVAETATFLSTPQAAGITGSVVRVCGGAYIGA